MIRHDIILEDTTLRDGEQAPRMAFSKETKHKILDKLIAAGVRWVAPGIPAVGGEGLATLHDILERKDEAPQIGWNRGIMDDFAATIDMGFEAVHIGLPTGGGAHTAGDAYIEEALIAPRIYLLARLIEDIDRPAMAE